MRLTFLIWLAPEDARAELLNRVNDQVKKHSLRNANDRTPPPADIQSIIADKWQTGTEYPAACHG